MALLLTYFIHQKQIFGRNVDQNMNPFFSYPEDEGGYELPFTEPTDQPRVSYEPDFTSMLKNTAEGRESDYVMFTHFERPPSVIYRLNVDLANDCSVQVKSIEPVDASEWGGAYLNVVLTDYLHEIFYLVIFSQIYRLQAFGFLVLDLPHRGILTLVQKRTSLMQNIFLPM